MCVVSALQPNYFDWVLVEARFFESSKFENVLSNVINA